MKKQDQAQKLRELVKAHGIASQIKEINKDDVKVDQRTLARFSKKGAKVITVTSGKGGVGKSIFVANLALSLARLNKRVLIVDADFGLANIDVILNVYPKYNLGDVVEGRKTVDDCLVKCYGSVYLISGGSGIQRLANLNHSQRTVLINSLQQFEDKMDFILIDTGAGISHNVVNIALAAHQVVVVTTPEPTAITDAYAMVKVIMSKDKEADLKIMVNMVKNKHEAEAVSERISLVAKQFLNVSLEKSGFIFKDALIPIAVRDKKPFILSYPAASPSRCINNFAKQLCFGYKGYVYGKDLGRKSFFHRLTNLFSGEKS